MKIFKDYANFYNLIYKRRDYKSEAQMVYRWAEKPPIIFDLGCGTGLHHRYWKCLIIGIDKSKEMLSKVDKRNNAVYYVSDIEKDILLKQSPCYTALFNVVGYCDLEKIIAQMKQRRGGIFIFDCWDKDKFQKDKFSKRTKKLSWGRVEIEPEGTSLRISVFPKGGKPFHELHTVKPYALHDIEKLCQKFGYSGIRKDTDTWTTWYKLIKQ
jgi:SAM-dependent methyltransferase